MSYFSPLTHMSLFSTPHFVRADLHPLDCVLSLLGVFHFSDSIPHGISTRGCGKLAVLCFRFQYLCSKEAIQHP